MEIIKIAGIALTGVISAALLKSINKDISLYVILATAVIILIAVLGEISEIFSFIENIYDDITYGREFFPVIIKVLIIAYITDFTAQLCKDAGEGSIGSKVELAGKVIIFYVAMPILTAILEVINVLLR
ncbi:MAG: stage III sporulation protein AD [Firmicutes bacterium]|nr:stage III sporulation protein AD [Bacillota bacterium]MBQ3610820.1 stage III sporulation protein AD [Bacillota bacterium]MBR6799881.1 stage III sporulation protein AD [Bacillota bacterium]